MVPECPMPMIPSAQWKTVKFFKAGVWGNNRIVKHYFGRIHNFTRSICKRPLHYKFACFSLCTLCTKNPNFLFRFLWRVSSVFLNHDARVLPVITAPRLELSFLTLHGNCVSLEPETPCQETAFLVTDLARKKCYESGIFRISTSSITVCRYLDDWTSLRS